MISVIIINHNTPEVTLKCLEHLHRSQDVEFETIVINNTPEDKLFYPKVKIFNNPKRLGFGANNNKGMKVATGDRILLLNSDCFVNPDTLSILNTQYSILNWDVVGCRLTDEHGKTRPSSGYFPTLRRIILLMSFIDNMPMVRRFVDSIHVRDLSRYENGHEVDWVQGAFVFLKREVYDKTGGFDENFHMYGEEIEWQYRIKKAGFKVFYFPKVSAVHLERMSVKSYAGAFIGEMKGYLYWFKKYQPDWQQRMLAVVLFGGCIIRIPAWSVWGKWDLVRAYVQILPTLLSEIFPKTK